jgi:hypothetical protein
MQSFAPDMISLVLRGRVIKRNNHRLITRHAFQHNRRQDFAQRQQRPNPARKNAVKAAEVADGCCTQGTQSAGDGALAWRQDQTDHQQDETLESRAGECYTEARNDWPKGRRNAQHVGLLSDFADQRSASVGRSPIYFNRKNYRCSPQKRAKVELKGRKNRSQGTRRQLFRPCRALYLSTQTQGLKQQAASAPWAMMLSPLRG